jgi:hypothetical protein
MGGHAALVGNAAKVSVVSEIVIASVLGLGAGAVWKARQLPSHPGARAMPPLDSTGLPRLVVARPAAP